MAMGSPATSPHPKTSYRLRNRPKKKKQLLKKSSPKLSYQVILLPLSISKSKIIKFDYLLLHRRTKIDFQKQILSGISDKKKKKQPDGRAERKELQVGNRRAIKTSFLFTFLQKRKLQLQLFLYTGKGERRCQREQLHLSLSTLLFILYQEGKKSCVKAVRPILLVDGSVTESQKQEPGCQVAFL